MDDYYRVYVIDEKDQLIKLEVKEFDEDSNFWRVKAEKGIDKKEVKTIVGCLVYKDNSLFRVYHIAKNVQEPRHYDIGDTLIFTVLIKKNCLPFNSSTVN